MLSLLSSFSSKIYGKRSADRRRKKKEEEQKFNGAYSDQVKCIVR